MAQLTEASGVITSPFYPRKYPDDQNCTWQITASKGNRLKLKIENTMDLLECGYACNCDSLDIQNGFDSKGNPSEKKCGTLSAPLIYYSIHEGLKLQFISDHRNTFQNKGFSAIYTQLNYTPEGKCLQLIHIENNAKFSLV